MCFKKLPHPEEKKPSPTFIYDWYENWDIWDIAFFEQVPVKIVEIAWPACKSGDTIYIHPKWTNPGVLAHEMCHVIWPLIDGESFATDFILNADEPMLKLLLKKPYAKKNFKNGNFVEVHAELGRYIGQYMPEYLKKYYPHMWS